MSFITPLPTVEKVIVLLIDSRKLRYQQGITDISELQLKQPTVIYYPLVPRESQQF